MGLIDTLRFITRHPLNRHRPMKALGRFLHWQVVSRTSPWPVLYPWVNGSGILVWKGLTGLTGNVYCGLHEFEDMAFVLHFLRQGDLFLDVGANVGSYTILGGTSGASVVAVEPLPATFRLLCRNIGVNSFAENVRALNIGLSNAAGTLHFTDHLDTVNHVVPPGTANSRPVRVDTLDTTCADRTPVLIKIDVEGYEKEVLQGGAHTLENPALKALIVELNDSGKRYGTGENEVLSLLDKAGFQRMEYDPRSRSLSAFSGQSHTGNGLFVRDPEFVRQRLKEGKAFRVNGVVL
jgi:FkbM family methyltransferase